MGRLRTRVLALGGVLVLAGGSVAPIAAAQIVPDQTTQLAAAQSIAVPSYLAPELVQRDAFGYSAYSVVQMPVTPGTAISSGFGYRSCEGCTTNHTGVDFTPGYGAPAFAVADGVVTSAGYRSDYGVYVVLEHQLNGRTVSTLYSHLQNDGAADFAVGTAVERGTVLGNVGATGQVTGPNMHFAAFTGQFLNGESFLEPTAWLAANVNT